MNATANRAHTSRPWRIHEIAPDFRLEDVWELPGRGQAQDFPRLVEVIASLDPAQGSSAVAVHGVMHIGAVPDGDGGFRAQMAVLVKPNGKFGDLYVAAIRPFRHLVVYPPMLKDGERAWQAVRD